MPATYSLPELAEAADVTTRTIRYYIAQGLLPAPLSVGPGARYHEGHLLRLRLVKELQREHLPLAEIRSRLAALSEEDVRTILDQPRARVAESAIDYVRDVLGGPGHAQRMLRRATTRPDGAGEKRLSRLSLDLDAMPIAADLPASLPRSVAEAHVTGMSFPTPDRSQWDRIALTTDVELHVRRPLSRIQNKRVERLIALARKLLEEDQP